MQNPLNFESGYSEVNGLKMYYEIHGKGAMPLVLIHGGGSTIETSFGSILPLFSKYRKVIAVELQAHGRTSDRDTPESFLQDADDVATLLKNLKLAKADILGFSNGGTTALHIAIRHPYLVNKLVIVSANYRKDGMVHGFFEGMQHASLDNMPNPLKMGFLKVTPDQDGLQTMFEKDKQRMLNFEDMSDDDLQSIKAPTLLMVADKDVVLPKHVLKMSRLIPNARLVVLPGTHGSFIGEVCTAQEGSKLPGITVDLIEEFLHKTGAGK